MKQWGFQLWVNGVVGSNLIPNRRRARLLRMAGLDVADGVYFWPGLVLSHRPKIRIEPEVWVGAGTHIAGDGQLTIGRRTCMGPRVLIVTSTHDPEDKTRRAGRIIDQPVVIEEECWIGGDVMICSGVTIGRGAVVGGKSLVTKDVPPNTLVAGVPARVIRELDELEPIAQRAGPSAMASWG